MERPPVHYALTQDGVNIAYQVFGDGPLDILFVGSWFGQIDNRWDWPGYRRWFERLATFARVAVFDKRGVGASDPAPPRSVTLEDWVDDARTVMDAAGFARPAVVTWTDATVVGLSLAATFPERTRALAIVNWSYDLFTSTLELTSGFPEWGGDEMLSRLPALAPSDANNPAFQDWFLRTQRASAGPGAVAAMYAMLRELDVEAIIPLVSVPTIVVRRTRLPSSAELAKELARLMPDAKYVEVPGQDIHCWAGDVDLLIDEVETFLTGARPAPKVDRVLLAVLFTDMVGSTPKAVQLGDRQWRALLDGHDQSVRSIIAAHQGREVLTKGDEFLVTFDGPARAVRCAQAIHAAAATQGLEMRTGIHIGEVELRGDDIAGIAVHIGARVRELAAPNEILVSRTVKDLVAGSGLEFLGRGSHELKGVPDTWELYAVET